MSAIVIKQPPMPNIRVSLHLSGKTYESDICLNQITQALGVEPTKARKKSDFPIGSQRTKVARDSWSLVGIRSQSYNANEQIEEFLNFWEEKKGMLKDLMTDLDLNASVSVSIHTNKQEGYPIMLFSRKLVQFSADISASIVIDDYRYN